MTIPIVLLLAVCAGEGAAKPQPSVLPAEARQLLPLARSDLRV
jgi:hypothetical protein